MYCTKEDTIYILIKCTGFRAYTFQAILIIIIMMMVVVIIDGNGTFFSLSIGGRTIGLPNVVSPNAPVVIPNRVIMIMMIL